MLIERAANDLYVLLDEELEIPRSRIPSMGVDQPIETALQSGR
jgi:hypothetical protein